MAKKLTDKMVETLRALASRPRMISRTGYGDTVRGVTVYALERRGYAKHNGWISPATITVEGLDALARHDAEDSNA